MDKIGIVNSVFEYSSTGLLTKQLYEYGKKLDLEMFVFYGRGPKEKDDHIIRIESPIQVLVHKILTLITGYQGYFSNFATSRLINKLKKEKIKKIILLNLHGYYLNEKRLLNYLKKKNIRTVYVTPDEYAGLGKCCFNKGCEKYMTECSKCPQLKDYPKSFLFDRSKAIFLRKKMAYSGFNNIVFLGPETNLEVFHKSVLLKDKPMKRVSWGVDTSIYRYEVDESIYRKYDIPRSKIIVLTVANYSNPRKGVKEYFFEIAKQLVDSDYHFINVGYDGNLKPEEIPANMTLIGYVHDQVELAHIYSISDVYLLASTTDTMPLSCLIALACETPVICFYTSGLKNFVNTNNVIIYSAEVNLESLKKTVLGVGKKTNSTMKDCRKLVMEEYSIDYFNKKVYEEFGYIR